MTDATMLEKAARALAAEDARDRGVDLYDKNSGLYVRLARAVLMAVRGIDGHGIEMNWWSERIVDAILADGEGR